MALVLADRVKDTTTTTGQGTVSLSGTAPTGYQNFSAIGNGNTTYYTIAGGSEWEVGIGTYTSSGTTLSRDTVFSSSAGGTTKVTFSAGTKDVFVTLPAEVVPNYVYTKTTFTATAGQTTFTVAYTVGYIDVYLNGVKLTTSEYTASNGTSVVLGTAAALNDIVETIAWSTFSATNTNIGVGTGTSLALNGATLGSNALAVAGTETITSASANAFAVGRQGATNPVLNVDASTASVVTGLNLKGAAAAGGMALSVTSSGTNENLTIDAKGSGTITMNATGTGSVLVNRLLDISASTAGQIKFPATQNASADANTLDDYEEGTWTPTYTDGTNNASGYLAQVANYVKIGSLVTLGFYVRANGLGSMSGPVYVGGLPFTSKNTTNLTPAGSVGAYQIWTLGSTYSQLGLQIYYNDTKIAVVATGSGLTWANATAAMMVSNASLNGAISYTV